MNFTLKALVAAAALVAAGSANAAYNKASTGDGELALYVYDTVSKNTFGFDLTNNGTEQYTTKSILTAGDASWSVTGSAAWVAFTSAFGTAPADTLKWAIWSGDSTGTAASAGTNVLGVTAQAGVDAVNFGVTNGNMKLAVGAGGVGKDNVINGLFTPTTDTDPSFFSTSATNNYLNQFTEYNGLSSTAFFNMTNSTNTQTAEFFSLTNNPNGLQATVTDVGSFTFNYAAGTLSFVKNVPAVPESDTYAMLLAGLGVMGLVARRRLVA